MAAEVMMFKGIPSHILLLNLLFRKAMPDWKSNIWKFDFPKFKIVKSLTCMDRGGRNKKIFVRSLAIPHSLNNGKII